jgi:hypothetical protein
MHQKDSMARLLDRLLEPGAPEQAAALLHRDPAAHVSLQNSYRVTPLLDSLRKAGAREQVTALADRAAAHVPLQHPSGVAQLVSSLRNAGAPEQGATLADRLPGAGMFEFFRRRCDSQDRFGFGREADGSPASRGTGKIWTDAAGLCLFLTLSLALILGFCKASDLLP